MDILGILLGGLGHVGKVGIILGHLDILGILLGHMGY